jgi:hypothetical protein
MAFVTPLNLHTEHAYVKCISAHNVVHVTMLTSKSRVAPIKKQTLPTLELCGALLLARLLHKVIDALSFEQSNNIFCVPTLQLS